MRVIEDYRSAGMVGGEDLVSVVVAAYNVRAYLERCVRSILGQSYGKLEVILVDDGATDGSGELCDRLAGEDDRIRVVHKKNGGLSDARNAGTAVAVGRFIAYVDGDDYIEPEMYGDMLGALSEFGGDVAVCGYRRIYRDGVVDRSTGKAAVFEGREALRCLVEEDEVFQIQNAAWNKLYRRDLIEGERRQRFPVGKWYEDIVYTAVLLGKCQRCVYLDRGYYNYVIDREGSIMNTGINIRVLTDQIPAYHEKTEYLKSIGEEELAAIHNYFFYKRLLLFYTDFFRSQDGKRQEYCRKLREIILKERGNFDAAYAWSGCNAHEKQKMKLFILSPAVYNAAMWLNDGLVIPLKTWISNA